MFPSLTNHEPTQAHRSDPYIPWPPSRPRRDGIPGAELKGVHVLRDVAQANVIAAQMTAESNVVVVGASFIGMEVAAYCVSKVASVTVLVRDSVPFRQLGQEIGKTVMDMFVEKVSAEMVENRTRFF